MGHEIGHIGRGKYFTSAQKREKRKMSNQIGGLTPIERNTESEIKSIHSSTKKSIHSHTNTNPDSQKVVIHKFERKNNNTLNSSANRKNQLKFDIVDLSTYAAKISKQKTEVLNSSIKSSYDRSFIPNAHLNTVVAPKIKTPDETFTEFKKKMSFLNYFSTQNDY